MKLLTFTVALLALTAVHAETDGPAEENSVVPDVTTEIVKDVTEAAATEVVTEISSDEPKVTEEVTEVAEEATEEVTEEATGATTEPEATATANEANPTTSEPVTEEVSSTSTTTENANAPHTECSCQMTTGLLGHTTIPVNELANGPLTGFKRKAGKCDAQTFIDCREDCKLLVPTFTHDFDLTAPPFTRRDSDEKSLGARICTKIGTQPFFARIGLRAEVRCDVRASDAIPARPNYTSANLMSSKQRLSCVAGLPIISPF